jgi:hypothetical protein
MPDRKLASVITLRDGAELCTIGDVAALIEERFSTTRTWGALEATLRLLEKAAESGKRDDLDEATDALVCMLYHGRMLGPIGE